MLRSLFKNRVNFWVDIKILRGSLIFKYLIFFFFTWILFPGNSKADFFINDESIYNGDTIGIHQTNSIFNNVSLHNIGNMKFFSDSLLPAQIILNYTVSQNVYLGSGSFEIKGNQPFNLNFNTQIRLGRIVFDNGQNDNYVNAFGFEADSSIMLYSGRLLLENEDAFIKINNSNNNALGFNNTPYSSTYIIGRLVRNISYPGEYYFPTGDDVYMFLMAVESINDEPRNIGVKFNKDLISNWSFMNANSQVYEIRSEGGWEVDDWLSKTQDIPLKLTAFKHHFSGLNNGSSTRMAYIDREQYPNTYAVLSNLSNTTNTTDFVTAYNQRPSGYYALAIDEGFTPEVIPNFIIGLDGNNCYFRIPGIADLLSASLIVYDRWGHEVYSEANYMNQLDTRNLPRGTYYYVFKYDRGEGEIIHQSFFEVYK